MQAASRATWAKRSPESQEAFILTGKLGRLLAKVERHHDQFSPAQVQRILGLFVAAA